MARCRSSGWARTLARAVGCAPGSPAFCSHANRSAAIAGENETTGSQKGRPRLPRGPALDQACFAATVARGTASCSRWWRRGLVPNCEMPPCRPLGGPGVGVDREETSPTRPRRCPGHQVESPRTECGQSHRQWPRPRQRRNGRSVRTQALSPCTHGGCVFVPPGRIDMVDLPGKPSPSLSCISQ